MLPCKYRELDLLAKDSEYIYIHTYIYIYIYIYIKANMHIWFQKDIYLQVLNYPILAKNCRLQQQWLQAQLHSYLFIKSNEQVQPSLVTWKRIQIKQTCKKINNTKKQSYEINVHTRSWAYIYIYAVSSKGQGWNKSRITFELVYKKRVNSDQN